MRVLHDVPIVTGVLDRRPATERRCWYSTRACATSYERVRLSLEPLTLEDVTKVWTALALRYRLSAAYVRQRRPDREPPGRGLPARRSASRLARPCRRCRPTRPAPGPWIQALTIQTPTSPTCVSGASATPDEQPFPYAPIGDTLVLRGTSLSGPETNVVFGDLVRARDARQPAPRRGRHPRRIDPGRRRDPAGAPAAAGRPDGPGHRPQPAGAAAARSRRNEAAFMLVPAVNPLTLAYAAGPPARSTINGEPARGPGPGRRDVIGRGSSVERPTTSAAVADAARRARPDDAPDAGRAGRGRRAAAADPVAIGAGPRTLRITVGGTVR